MSLIQKLLSPLLASDHHTNRRAEIYRNILRDDARMGGQLFGPIPQGMRREFFCLDRHTWIWHEEWTDGNNIRHARTTRYDIRPQGIYKAQDGVPYQPVSEQEAHHLYAAMRQYQKNLHERFDPLIATARV